MWNRICSFLVIVILALAVFMALPNAVTAEKLYATGGKIVLALAILTPLARVFYKRYENCRRREGPSK